MPSWLVMLFRNSAPLNKGRAAYKVARDLAAITAPLVILPFHASDTASAGKAAIHLSNSENINAKFSSVVWRSMDSGRMVISESISPQIYTGPYWRTSKK